MNGRRVALVVLGAGALASQAGHLLAYSLRFGATAPLVQSSGVHQYFPALAKTGLGLLAVAFVSGLLVVALARVIAGRLDKDSAPSYVRLLAALYTLQLAVFAGQETIEAAIGGGRASSAAVLILWGTAGQLPVAAVAALAVRWLLARVGPALTRVLSLFVPVVQPLVASLAARPMPPLAYAVAGIHNVALDHSRRGPPL